MPQKINLNRINKKNITNLVRYYRKWAFYNKLILWGTVIAIPSIFFLVDNTPKQAGITAIGLSIFALSIHLLLTYTKYIALIVPLIAHIIIMPFSFGIYWASTRVTENLLSNISFSDIYTQGTLFGTIYTPLLLLAVFNFTRGKIWVTLLMTYISVDFIGLFLAIKLPTWGLLIPVLISMILITLRSKLLHKLIFRSKYSIPENNIFTLNAHDEAQKKIEPLLSDYRTIPLHGSFFDYLVVNDNRVFAIYTLHLKKIISISIDDKAQTKLSYASKPLDQEIGYISKQVSKLSKKWRIDSKEITPVIICDNSLPKNKGFVGSTVNQTGATLAGNQKLTGIVYFLDKEKINLLSVAWKNHTISKRTKTIFKKYDNPKKSV